MKKQPIDTLTLGARFVTFEGFRMELLCLRQELGQLPWRKFSITVAGRRILR